jgi:hypothetical protein
MEEGTLLIAASDDLVEAIAAKKCRREIVSDRRSGYKRSVSLGAPP